MNTPIYIINLKKSTERRTFIQQQFDALANQLDEAIPLHFFDAVNGKENPNFPLFRQYNEAKRLKIKGNGMNLSQLGCFASHYLLWKQCVEQNQPIIVLEDDAIIHPHFIPVYRFLSSQENMCEFLWLSPPAPARRGQTGKKKYAIAETDCWVTQYYKDWGNATGYFLTPESAKKLLDYTQEWIYDVDITMERYWENGISHYAVTPACIEPDFSKESNIPVDKAKNKRSLGVKLRREYYKSIDKLKKCYYDYVISK